MKKNDCLLNHDYKINLMATAWGTIDNKTLLVKITGSKLIVFSLNGIGEKIWKMLLKNYCSLKIIKNLAKEYPSARKQIKKDYTKFIRRLLNLGILNEV